MLFLTKYLTCALKTHQSDDGALSSELCRAEERSYEAVDEFVFRVDHRVVIWNLFSLLTGGLIIISESAQSDIVIKTFNTPTYR